MNHCPAVLISAPASGQGKTTITAAIARHARNTGKTVRVFKTGPDFLDPMILERASGHPVYQLDLFMGGLMHCRALLAQAAAEADLILVEGVMGLFDGEPSSADLAHALGLPVLAVMDASSMAQTFGALALGLQRYRPDLRFAGVVANRVGSAAHAQMIEKSLPAGLDLVAAVPRHTELSLPERHLGLVQALELPDLDAQLDAWAAHWGQALHNVQKVQGGGFEFESVEFYVDEPPEPRTPPLLQGRRIAVAQDAAFSFIYPANLDCLRELGAEVRLFAPLQGQALPECDALWLPGGYPELHAQALREHPSFYRDLRTHVQAGKPLLAECGGMLCLLEQLIDAEGQSHAMAGLLPGSARLQKRLAALGLQAIAWPGRAPEQQPEHLLRGHTFHYSVMDSPLSPIAHASNPNAGRASEALFDHGSVRASYIHHYFPSNPAAIAAFFGTPGT
jgi:cobyrinic acid a,c-diamide synthase